LGPELSNLIAQPQIRARTSKEALIVSSSVQSISVGGGTSGPGSVRVGIMN